jgi:predicted RecA/RadA family phage recombinase
LVGIVVAAVALKVKLVVPATTIMAGGTVNNGLLLASAMVVPPAGAAVLSVAEQVEIWPPFRLPGAHAIEESTGTAMMPPPVVNAARLDPVAETPTGFDTPIEVVVALAASVN